MKIKIDPIKINIENNWKFSMVAYLVDKYDFLCDVLDARKNLNLKEVIPYKSLPLSFPVQNISNIFSVTFAPITKRDIKINEILRALDNGIVEYLRNKYKKSKFFSNVIRFSILCGEVFDAHFNLTPYFVYPEETPYTNFVLEETEGAIVFYPETTPSEISKIFKDYTERHKLPDTVNNIKRDRKWYWQNAKGMSLEEIRKNYLLENKSISKQGVFEAIKAYKRHLSTP